MDAAAPVRSSLQGWWASLGGAPEPLARHERRIVWIAAIVVAATRPLAIAKSLWDWDEALFGLALREYDVVAHHPHPPGFPLFILAAKALVLASGATEFRALQGVAVTASLLVFPAMFFLARELRTTFFVATASAAVLAFLPNVWFFGGTGLSDVPSMTLSLLSCALLLRGVRSNASAVAGPIALAVAAGFRPQTLLIAFLPALIVLARRPRAALAGAGAALLIVMASYGGAAAASGGWREYQAAAALHEHYIRTTDSWLSLSRPSLAKVADDFLYRPYRVPFANAAIALLAVIGCVRRRPASLAGVALFGPFLLFAWLMLDFHSTSRFSIAYVPMFALLAAEGAEALRGLRLAAVAMLIAAIAVWMWEPLQIVRETVSPPVAAAEWIRSEHRDRIVLVDPRLLPLAEFLLPGMDLRVGADAAEAPAVAYREFVSREPGARNFVRPRPKLARALTRPRYFEISVVPVPAAR